MNRAQTSSDTHPAGRRGSVPGRLLELLGLLTARQRQRLLRLQLLVFAMAALEVLGIFSIAPFMALVADPDALAGRERITVVRDALGLTDDTHFLIAVAGGVLAVLALSTLTSTLTLWKLIRYANGVGADVANRLYRHYLRQDWLFHQRVNSSDLQARIAQETLRLTVHILKPAVEMNAQLFKGALIAISVFLFDPAVAIVAVLVFGSAYFTVYRLVRGRLAAHGRAISTTQQDRFRYMAEGLGGIRDVLLLGRQESFENRFSEASERFARGVATTQILTAVPRFAMEFVAIGGVVALVLFLLVEQDGDLQSILPSLSVFAFAGFKMLPAFQQVYASLSMIRSHLSALDSIEPDLRDSLARDPRRDPGAARSDSSNSSTGTSLREQVELRDLGFTYPGSEQPALDGLSAVIPARSVVAFVGVSGSGKSTLIDLLLGLLRPQRGALVVDGVPVETANLRDWQDRIGFVPQDMFLSDASLRENIAFGVRPEEIEEERVSRAVDMAQLGALVARLPAGLDTHVGERGVQLSGGQRQRIGIARALYQGGDLLILDEATSALDGITERSVLEAIGQFAGSRTIVMVAHRLSTVQHCDRIYLMEQGRIVDQGTFDELLTRNASFRSMANRS